MAPGHIAIIPRLAVHGPGKTWADAECRTRQRCAAMAWPASPYIDTPAMGGDRIVIDTFI